MSRSLLVAFLGAAFLVAPMGLPSAFLPAAMPGLSGAAHAVTNLNSSRSNIYRKSTDDAKPKPKPNPKPSSSPKTNTNPN
jgi:hypothetical protein